MAKVLVLFGFLKMIKISALIRNTENPRIIKDENFKTLCENLRTYPKFLEKRPIIIKSFADPVIIAGDKRFEALKFLGYKEIDDSWVKTAEDFTEDEIKAFILIDNTHQGEWDFHLLAKHFGDVDLSAIGIDFPENWQDILSNDIPEAERSNEEEFARIDEQTETVLNSLDEIQAKWKTAEGEIWVLGSHRIICGDSTDKAIIDKLMKTESAELLFTSPPYLDQRTYETKTDLSAAKITKFIEHFSTIAEFQVVNLGIVRKNSEVVTYWDDFIIEARNCGLKLISWNVWDKMTPGGIAQQTAMFGIEHEFIFIFGNKPKKLNLTVPNDSAGKIKKTLCKREQNGDISREEVNYVTRDKRQIGTVYRGSRMTVSQNMFDHPAPFSVEFPYSYIEAMTSKNGIVCEPFLGSGTTLIACEMLNRQCRGIELSPKYLAGTLERWYLLTGKTPVLV